MKRLIALGLASPLLLACAPRPEQTEPRTPLVESGPVLPAIPDEAPPAEAPELAPAPDFEKTGKVAPGSKFDLAGWKLTLPDLDPARGKAREVDEGELSGAEGGPFLHEQWFYLDEEAQAIVFKTPNHLATTANSKNTRSELREMLRAGDTEIGTKDMKNNWVLSNHPRASEYGAIGGIMKATLAVDWVSTSGDDSKFSAHAVVVGQIHGSGKTEPLKIFYRKLPGHEKGSLFWNYEVRPENQDEREDVPHDVWGSHKLTKSDEEPADGLKLGEKFSYVVDVQGTKMTLVFSRAGKADVKQVHDLGKGHPKFKRDLGYGDDWMYFKAGAYNQCNLGTEGVWGSACENRGEEAGDYVQVRFFSLSVEH